IRNVLLHRPPAPGRRARASCRGPFRGHAGGPRHASGDASASTTTYGRGVSSAQMIDWELAISTGVRFARQGPNVSLAEARAVVAELRGLTAVVQQPVRDVTGLVSQGSIGPVAVVDRPGW